MAMMMIRLKAHFQRASQPAARFAAAGATVQVFQGRSQQQYSSGGHFGETWTSFQALGATAAAVSLFLASNVSPIKTVHCNLSDPASIVRTVTPLSTTVVNKIVDLAEKDSNFRQMLTTSLGCTWAAICANPTATIGCIAGGYTALTGLVVKASYDELKKSQALEIHVRDKLTKAGPVIAELDKEINELASIVHDLLAYDPQAKVKLGKCKQVALKLNLNAAHREEVCAVLRDLRDEVKRQQGSNLDVDSGSVGSAAVGVAAVTLLVCAGITGPVGSLVALATSAAPAAAAVISVSTPTLVAIFGVGAAINLTASAVSWLMGPDFERTISDIERVAKSAASKSNVVTLLTKAMQDEIATVARDAAMTQ